MQEFIGTGVALITPFKENKTVDFDALERLAERLSADSNGITRFQQKDMPKPEGELSNSTIIQSFAATMPEDIIVCTDSGGGNAAYPTCQNRAPHSWLSLTGGAIGQGGPVATGAALAAQCGGASKRKPNVVYVFADQWRSQDLGYAGNTQVHTPTFDKLAAEGINLTNAVSGFPPFRRRLSSSVTPPIVR